MDRSNVAKVGMSIPAGVALALAGWATSTCAGTTIVTSSSADHLRYEAPIGHRQPRRCRVHATPAYRLSKGDNS